MEQPRTDNLKIVIVGRELEPLEKRLKEEKYKVHLSKNRFVPIDEKKDLYVFHVENSNFTRLFNKMIEIIKKKFPEAKTMFSGPFAWKYPSKILLDSNADFICIGDDDEETILELCRRFGHILFYSSILGLGYKGIMVVHPKMPYPKEGIFLSNKRLK